jgi:hypothetical protein
MVLYVHATGSIFLLLPTKKTEIRKHGRKRDATGANLEMPFQGSKSQIPRAKH